MTIPPSGEQFEIHAGDQAATIVEVGGGIRAFTVGGRDVLEPYPVDAASDGAHGSLLIPWPNRIADGRYRFDGIEHQLALSEPARQNAIHGLVRWRSWTCTTHEPDRVELGTRIHPMTGYPFLLDLRVVYSLDDAGLTVTTTATNAGDRACPYGVGQHPYLSPGAGSIDACRLQLDAATRHTTDEARQLPTGTEAVKGTAFDFRAPRRLGNQAIDHAFTDLARDDRGRAWVRLTGPDGRTAELWVDHLHPFIQLYTGDTLDPARRRTGLGAEPMTCPPNAFASGEHLVRLAPGGSHTTSWGAMLTPGL